MHLHTHASAHIDTAHICKKHIEEYPYIYIYTKETIRGPDISVDALKNNKEN